MARDFEGEFAMIVSQFAAEDIGLVNFYKTKMSGGEQHTTDTAIELIVSHEYDLTPEAYQAARARCIARIAGLQYGCAGVKPPESRFDG